MLPTQTGLWLFCKDFHVQASVKKCDFSQRVEGVDIRNLRHHRRIIKRKVMSGRAHHLRKRAREGFSDHEMSEEAVCQSESDIQTLPTPISVRYSTVYLFNKTFERVSNNVI